MRVMMQDKQLDFEKEKEADLEIVIMLNIKI
jgi:hypothetical protein